MDTRNINNFQLNSLFESGVSSDPLDEILYLFKQISPDQNTLFIQNIHKDVTDLFSGKHPEFNTNTNKYHNLRHTLGVVLATIRLLHGLYYENKKIPGDLITQTLVSAYFHDSGYVPQRNGSDKGLTNHATQHEKKSIVILQDYLEHNNLPEEYKKNCSIIIQHTILDEQIENYGSLSSHLKLCGQVLGTADIIAQMADRYYLENLPLLFQEQKENGTGDFSSALELMGNTVKFHEKVIKKRLSTTLGNLFPAMRTHFNKRWNLDRNLYLDNIALNIEYLNLITEDCQVDLSCWGKYLRRVPPNPTP